VSTQLPYEIRSRLELTIARWTAISRGAVYKGFLESSSIPPHPNPIEITSKVSRLHLGNSFRTPFIEGEHPESSKAWDSDYRGWYAEDLMKWHIKKVRCSLSN
jgi:hypothetical protein